MGASNPRTVRGLTAPSAPGKMAAFQSAADDPGEGLLVRIKRALLLLAALALVGAGVAALSGLAGAGVAGIQGSGKSGAIAGIEGSGRSGAVADDGVIHSQS